MTVTISRWASGFYVEADGVVKLACSRYDHALACAKSQGTPDKPWPKAFQPPKITREVTQ